MIEIDEFYNDGFGWVCKRCDRESTAWQAVDDKQSTPRVWREGEAETKQPRLSTDAQAKWTDAARQQLVCPRCGTIETLAKV